MCLIDCIKENYGLCLCCTDYCEENECYFYVDSENDYAILDANSFDYDEEKCDCIVFEDNDSFFVYILELKSNSYSIEKVKRQLEGGGIIADEILGVCKTDINYCKIFPILLYKSTTPSIIKRLGKDSSRVLIGGKRLFIKPQKCGSRLSKFLHY